MTVEIFFDKFELFADARNAVAKMRELVLALAVKGKLVAQDEADEPADALITKAASVASKLPTAAKYARLREEADEHLEGAELLPLPRGWRWTCSAVIGDTAPRVEAEDDAIVAFAPMNVLPTDYRSTFVPEVRPWLEIKKGYTHFANGDVAFAKITPCFQNGKGCVFNKLPGGIGAGTTELHVLRPFAGIVLPLYALLYYKSPEFVTGGVASFSGTAGQQRVSNDYFRFAPFPLPPLAEQKRIVAKVDELMALCDRLEAQQQERETRHATLARASLARFAEAPTPANLDFLFHKSYDIAPADLRKSILTLAVQGKLVPQDPNDEPATQRLELIRARKAELLQKQLIKKSDSLRPVDPDEVDHYIPDSWAWVRLGEICELITDGTHQTPKYTEAGRMFLSAQNVKPFKFMPAKHRFVSEEHYQGYVKNRKPERGDILLTRVGAGIGEAATIDQELDFAIYVSLGLIRPVRGFIFSDYITLWLNSPDGTEKSSRNTYGKGVSQGNLNLSLIRNFLVPLPPFKEQRRIAAKVEELMVSVDALEIQLATARTAAADVLAAAVAEFTNAKSN